VTIVELYPVVIRIYGQPLIFAMRGYIIYIGCDRVDGIGGQADLMRGAVRMERMWLIAADSEESIS
jgi:hypothetical protein